MSNIQQPNIYNGVVVVGSGLAGLTTTLQLLKRGIPVTLLEKTAKFGGNSAKASSGINATPTKYQSKEDQSISSFYNDTIKSGKGLSNSALVHILTENSAEAFDWLTGDDLGIELSQVTMLGGHSHARTHRGSGKLPPGFAIISALTSKLEEYSTDGTQLLTIHKGSRLSSIINEKGIIQGVEYISDSDKITHKIFSKAVVLATGGFSGDFGSDSEAKTKSLLQKYRPDLVKFPLTNGAQTTGDGQSIAEKYANANLIHMDQVQVHPTGFIQLKSEEAILNRFKFLCGEVIRGIGGILISPVNGKRFIDELSTRDVVTESIISNCPVSENNLYGLESDKSVALIVVSEEDYKKAVNHIGFYMSQSLMFKGTINALVELSKKLHPNTNVNENTIYETLNKYTQVIKLSGLDDFKRKHHGDGFEVQKDQELYYGLVTPSIHFSMGGIEINNFGQAISKQRTVIENLYAVGETSGGVHGGNRLGGSSLLECVVFGTVVAKHLASKI